MNRLDAVNPATATGTTKELLDAVQSTLGATPNLFRTMAASPSALEGFLGLFGALSKGRFDARVRAAIALTVAQGNGCNYCLSAHSFLGRNAGLDDRALAASRHAESSDPRVKALLRLARQINEGRGDVSDAHFAEARKAGLNDADIAELIATVALNVFTNYFNKTARTEIDFPVITAAAA